MIIAGGMGGSAQSLFTAEKIDVVVGAVGEARRAAEDYLGGRLKSSDAVCDEHALAGQCND